MNWVLNSAACDYMLNKAPWLPFNQSQAKKARRDTEQDRRVHDAAPERTRSPNIDRLRTLN